MIQHPTEVQSDFIDEQNYIHIDAWFSDDDDAEGRTVAIVCMDTKKVFYIDSCMAYSKIVKEEIDKVLSSL